MTTSPLSRRAGRPAATLRRFATTTLALGALLGFAVGTGPAAAEAHSDSAVRSATSAKSPAPLESGRGLQAPSASPATPKGGLGAAEARKGFKPSFGAKPYRYFGRHGYATFGISRFGQGASRN